MTNRPALVTACLLGLALAGCATGPVRGPSGAEAAADPRGTVVPTSEPAQDRGYASCEALIVGRRSQTRLALGKRDQQRWTPSFNASTGFILGGRDGLDAFTNGVGASLQYRFHIASKLTLAFTAEQRDYNFDFNDGLFSGLGSEPSRMQDLGASLTLFQPLSETWAVFALGSIRGAAEVGVDPFSDPSLTGLLLVGHQLTPSLQLGLGVLVSARPGEDAFFLPIPQFEWKINERWSLGTDESGGALTYRASDQLSIAGLIGFDSVRYRLADHGAGTPGIFEDSRTTVALRTTWTPTDAVRFNARAGLDVLRYLEIADEDGDTLSDERAGIGGFVHFSLALSF